MWQSHHWEGPPYSEGPHHWDRISSPHLNDSHLISASQWCGTLRPASFSEMRHWGPHHSHHWGPHHSRRWDIEARIILNDAGLLNKEGLVNDEGLLLWKMRITLTWENIRENITENITKNITENVTENIMGRKCNGEKTFEFWMYSVGT